MTDFETYTIENAPEASKPILQAAKKTLGFVPNLMATMAESPGTGRELSDADGIVQQNGIE